MTLVEEWRRAWRWFSMQAMVMAAAVQAAWEGLPPDMRAAVPARLVTGVTLALLLLGIGGRLLRQRKG
jgi:hypothetical protein